MFVIFRNSYFPPPLAKRERTFLQVHCENLMGFLEVKPKSAGPTLRLAPRSF